MRNSLIWLSVVTAALLAACASPAPSIVYDAHAAFIERAKAGW